MNRQQIKYLLDLDSEKRKIALARLLVDYLDIFEKVKLGNYEDALERIREQMVRAGDRYQGRVPEGENEYVVRGDDLVRLLELDEGMADIIDEIKIVRQKLNGVIVQIVEEVKELKTAT